MTATLDLRDYQRPPEGHWATWLLFGGRGNGKTTAGLHWVPDMAMSHPKGAVVVPGFRVQDMLRLLVPVLDDAGMAPAWSAQYQRIVLPFGHSIDVHSGEPRVTRGREYGYVWVDEPKNLPMERVWPGLLLTMHHGPRRALITGTYPGLSPWLLGALAHDSAPVWAGGA